MEFAACESIGPLSPFPRENRYLSGTPDFGPTNEHELAIARIVDHFATAGKLDGSVIDLLASVLPLEDRAPDFEVSPLVIQEVEDQKQQDHQADARRPKSHGGQKRHDKNVGGIGGSPCEPPRNPPR